MTTRTAVPNSLHEYQEYVRKEALKIQRDMNWPDEKLNETLRALGLPEKLTFAVPVEITGTMIMAFYVTDAEDEAAARATIASKTPDELREMIRSRVSMGGFANLTPTLIDALPPLTDGGLDITLANPAMNDRSYPRSYCENYEPIHGRHYCTLPRGHEGDHAQGNGTNIVAVWAQS